MTHRIGVRDTREIARYRSNAGPKNEIIEVRLDAGLRPTPSLDPPLPQQTRRAHVQNTHAVKPALSAAITSLERGR
jgi:hypothetical protein